MTREAYTLQLRPDATKKTNIYFLKYGYLWIIGLHIILAFSFILDFGYL